MLRAASQRLLSKHRELPARVGGHRGRSGWAAARWGSYGMGGNLVGGHVEGLPRWTITVENFWSYLIT